MGRAENVFTRRLFDLPRCVGYSDRDDCLAETPISRVEVEQGTVAGRVDSKILNFSAGQSAAHFPFQSFVVNLRRLPADEGWLHSSEAFCSLFWTASL
jgi:hypothetical protein